MIKNNIKSLIFYIFIIIVTFFLLRGLMILENNTDLSMNNLIIKSIILILYMKKNYLSIFSISSPAHLKSHASREGDKIYSIELFT